MWQLPQPFQFDLASLISRLRKLPKAVDGVSISLPFVSISVKPEDTERRVAREIVIRMADRRVLNAFECCGDCIDRALTSLQEVAVFSLTSKWISRAIPKVCCSA